MEQHANNYTTHIWVKKLSLSALSFFFIFFSKRKKKKKKRHHHQKKLRLIKDFCSLSLSLSPCFEKGAEDDEDDEDDEDHPTTTTQKGV